MARFSGYDSLELGRVFLAAPGYRQPNCGFGARLQQRSGKGIECRSSDQYIIYQ
jgi:hypothetical protein